MVADIDLQFPPTIGDRGQALVNADGLGALGWADTGISQGDVLNIVAPLNSKIVVELFGTSNVASLSGIQTVDGASTTNAVHVCLNGQTDPRENGLWSVDDFAPWVRPLGWAGGIAVVPGSLVSVSSNAGGVSYSNTIWFGTGDGSSTASYVQIPVAGSANTGWGSITNVTPDKSYNANSTTVDELADVLGTLIAQLISQGLLRA